MAIPKLLRRTVARQLGDPSGPLGAVIARVLNKANRKPIEAAVSALGPLTDHSVADIGFGGGVGLELLLAEVGQGGRVHGVEPSTAMIGRARKSLGADLPSGRLVLHEAPMEALPFAAGELDGWISLNTIYFIDDLGPALTELRRVLAPTGVGALGVADPQWLGSQPFAEHGFTLRPVDAIVEQLEQIGFAVDHKILTNEHAPAPYNLLICRPAD